MYDIISSVLGILKVNVIVIDNNVFMLHHKVTTFILIVFSLLVTQKQYFGDPIDCIASSDIDLLDTYCWIQSTFTVTPLYKEAHAGVSTPSKEGQDKRYHTYYQWVTLILFLQALMFYIPHYLWKIWEGGKLRKLIEGMNFYMMDEAELEKKRTFLVSYFRINFNKQDLYAYKFFLCEVFNFVNIVCQIVITDYFVGNEFSDYGLKVLQETQKTFVSRNDALEYVFPKVTKCTYHRLGPSGTVETIDALCVLPLNVFIERIYIFLWFWFILVAVITGVALLYRAATFLPSFRKLLLKTKAKIVSLEEIHFINSKSRIGDWFLLYQIAKNMEENTFKTFISELAKELHQFLH